METAQFGTPEYFKQEGEIIKQVDELRRWENNILLPFKFEDYCYLEDLGICKSKADSIYNALKEYEEEYEEGEEE